MTSVSKNRGSAGSDNEGRARAAAACGPLLLWLHAIRAPFFTATLVPVLLGATIARGDLVRAEMTASWDWSLLWLVVAGALAAHAGTNLANDFGDHLSGNDAANRVPSRFNGGSRVIQAGVIAPARILLAATLSFCLTVVIGLFINWKLTGSALATTPLLALGISGCLLGITYTLGPWRLGYRGLGELAIALGFGPVMVLGSHYVLSAALPGSWNWMPPLLASLPVAMFAVLIIWINQFQDVPADRMVGKRNWVVRCARVREGKIRYELPFGIYRLLGYFGFTMILLLGIAGSLDAAIGTRYALLALMPLPLLVYANWLGRNWLRDWNRADADQRHLPYLLLRVNAITILLHLTSGLLLVLAYGLHESS